MTELLGLPYSPWTEKARWALDARRVAYAFRHYQPLLGEAALRAKVGRWTGKVSVPVLTDDEGGVHADSAAIARWADGRGEGPALFPAGRADEVTRWVELSERALAAGRALSLVRVLADREALAELVPPKVRAALGPLAPSMGAFGVRRTFRKYGGHVAAADAHRAAFVEALDQLAASLGDDPAGRGPRTLLGAFSFADVAMAQALAFVDPPAALRMGPGTRRTFRDPELAERYRDLLAWRDALYATFRTPS